MEKPDPPQGSPILIIEADAAKAKALGAVLDGLDTDIMIEDSVEAGQRRLESLPFAVVLLDVDSTGAGGRETAHALRQRNGSKCMPILFTGSHALADGDLAKLFSLQTVDFTPFPIPPVVIRTKVRMLLDVCQAHQAAWDLSERKATEAAGRLRMRELEALNDISKVLEQYPARRPPGRTERQAREGNALPVYLASPGAGGPLGH